MSQSAAPETAAQYRPETRLVHSGTLRSQFGETSEALFLTQGFVYDSAEQCEARFKGEETGFLYSRFSNPNVSMFERRMIDLEGAGAARATATGMAAVTTAILAPLLPARRARAHHRRGSCIACRRRIACSFSAGSSCLPTGAKRAFSRV